MGARWRGCKRGVLWDVRCGLSICPLRRAALDTGTRGLFLRNKLAGRRGGGLCVPRPSPAVPTFGNALRTRQERYNITHASLYRPSRETSLSQPNYSHARSPLRQPPSPKEIEKETKKKKKRDKKQEKGNHVPPKTQETLLPPPLRLGFQRLDVPLPRHGGARQRGQGAVPVLPRAPVWEERGGVAVWGCDYCWV